VDWLGVGYGATPELVRFWARNGYSTVHLATSRNATSGEYSVVMLDPCSDDGEALATRHSGWFQDRIAAVLSDPLDDCDPDVVRAVLRATDSEPSLSLSEWEWRVIAGVPGGASILDTNPRPFRDLARRHLSDPADPSALSEQEERLLVRKVLQARPWAAVTGELAFVSERECMRALGEAYQPLVDRYGDAVAHEEADRYR
jgi:tRNA(Met) cytidine acetyltransferase